MFFSFNEWRATARIVSDIGAETGNSLDDGKAGILYFDADGHCNGYIELTEAHHYRVLAAADEITTLDCAAAERWLWLHWSRSETASDDVRALADEFAKQLRNTLPVFGGRGDTLAVLVALNDSEPNGNICHSHDYCDANQVMLDAFAELYGRDADLQSRDGDLMAAAWDDAKACGFSN